MLNRIIYQQDIYDVQIYASPDMTAQLKDHICLLTFPAKGIRKGSVQNIPRRASAIKDVLTAIDSSIGSSGGITEVMIKEQLSISLYLLLVGSSSPCNEASISGTKGCNSRYHQQLKISFICYLHKYITSSN